MKPVMLIAIIGFAIGLGPPAMAYNADGNLSDWGTWGTSPDHDPRFDMTRGNVEWNTGWGPDDIATSDSSGGEWYDIEGLYMDVVTISDKTYLNWAIVTSYSGLEYGEWMPSSSWDGGESGAGTVDFQSGSGAEARDGINPVGWDYRSSPVIGISTDGDDTGFPASWEWALVLDNPIDGSNAEQVPTPYSMDTIPALYRVTEGEWVDWKPGTIFPVLGGGVDVDVTGLNASVRGQLGDSARRYAYKEISNDHQVPQSDWRQQYNWVWEGMLDITSIWDQPGGLNINGMSYIHYATWCGNDHVEPDSNGYNLTTTPELSSGALLLLGMVPVSLGWWRRRKTA